MSRSPLTSLPDVALRRVAKDVANTPPRVQYVPIGEDGEQTRTIFLPRPPPMCLVCVEFSKFRPPIRTIRMSDYSARL